MGGWFSLLWISLCIGDASTNSAYALHFPALTYVGRPGPGCRLKFSSGVVSCVCVCKLQRSATCMLYIHARAHKLILYKWHAFASFLLASLARLRCLGVMHRGHRVMWCRALTSGRRRHQCSTSRTGVLLAVASFQLARRALEMAQCRPEQPVRRHCRRDSGVIGRAVQHPSPLCVWWHRCMMSCKPCWVHRLKSRFFLADKGGQAFPVGMPPKVHAWRRSWHDYVGAA